MSFKTSPLTTKDVRGKQYLSSDIDSYVMMFCRIRICVMGPDGEKDCLSGLKNIGWIREVSPNKVFKCRHRTYTEVERGFLDYIDGELERTCFSFFKLKSIDYGDEKHKFVFPSMSYV